MLEKTVLKKRRDYVMKKLILGVLISSLVLFTGGLPLMAAYSPGDVLFEDEFSDPAVSEGQWVLGFDNMEWSFEDGLLKLKQAPDGWGGLVITEEAAADDFDWKNYEMEYRIRKSWTCESVHFQPGVVLRYHGDVSNPNLYLILYGASGNGMVWQLAGADWIDLFEYDSETRAFLADGDWHTVTARVTTDENDVTTITMLYNGEIGAVFMDEDAPGRIPSGRPGIYLELDNMVELDYFVVRAL